MRLGRGTDGYTSQGNHHPRRCKSVPSIDPETPARSSNKMPMAVKAAIKNAAVKVGNMSDEEATDFLGSMERSGRLIEETWS